MYKQYLALSALAAVNASTSDHWAVLVAGSNGFWNYRHQADTCHAYQIMKKNGIPENQIIHLSYDDVANSSRNPFKGQLFNKPAKGAGVDVYNGCKIDYKGADTTAANVVKVLTGDSSAKGPVLKSDANSKVFFYFADHGAPGLVAMPTGGYLYADTFHKALKTMHSKKMYKEMVVYIEACESGSMFENILEDNLGIYAVSAANSSESSWGAYCGSEATVNGTNVGSCLGDAFSVNWMEDTDKANLSKETLQAQYKIVQRETTKSHVLQWGETDFTNETLGNFQAVQDAQPVKEKRSAKQWWHHIKHAAKKWAGIEMKHFANEFATVDSRDVKLHQMYFNVKQNPSVENMNELADELKMRAETDARFTKLYPKHLEAINNKTSPLPTDFDCLRSMIDTYETECEKLNDYSLKWVKAFVSECEGLKSFPEARVQSLTNIKNACNTQ